MIDLQLETSNVAWLAWVFTYLAHSTLWVGGAWMLCRGPTLLGPASRNLIWRMALLGPLLSTPLQMVAGPAWTLHAVALSSAEPVPVDEAPRGPAIREAPATTPPPVVSHPVATGNELAPPERHQVSLATLALLLAAAIGLGRLAFLGVRMRRLQRALAGRSGVRHQPALALLARLRRRAVRPIPVRLTLAEGLASPVALWWNEICLPPRALSELDDEGLAAVLAHELAHLERRDSVWLVLGALVEAALFFQPLNRLARRHLQESAEVASDERAVELTGDSVGLARSLATVAEWGIENQAGALASPVVSAPGLLVHRVRVLLAADNGRRRRWRWAGAVATAGLSALVMLSPALALESTAPFPPLASVALDPAPTPPPTTWSPPPAPVPRSPSPVPRLEPPVRAPRVPRLTPPSPRPLPAVPRPTPRLPRLAANAPDLTGRSPTGGLWLMEITSQDAPVRLELRYGTRGEGRSHVGVGSTVPLSQLQGLSLSQALSSDALVRFRLKRDAGTFNCQGSFRDGRGAGPFDFQPDPAFSAALVKRGYQAPSMPQLFALAIHDVGLALVDEIKAQGYQQPTIDKLVRLAEHGVRLDYLQGLKAAGYTLGSLDRVVEMRDHGVTVDYIRNMAALGFKMSAEDIVKARDHGVNPELVKELHDLGYRQLTMAEIIKVRDHGVSPDFIRRLKTAGLAPLPIDQLVRARDHGVTPEMLKAIKDLGLGNLSMDEAVRMRDHGVSPDYVAKLKASGYDKLSIDQLIRVRDHGVSPDYIHGLNQVGYTRLDPDGLVRLRSHGVTPEYIRKLKARGYPKLSVDELVKLHNSGVQ